MIRTLSPYYLEINLNEEPNYTIDLYIWVGSFSTPPESPTYTITKENYIGVGTDRVNIAHLINDFIDVQYLGGRPVWVNLDVTIGGVLRVSNNYLASRGYFYGGELVTADAPTDKILMPNVEYKINTDLDFFVPILYNTSGVVTVKSYPNLNINNTFTPPFNDNSVTTFRNILIPATSIGNDEYIEITYNGNSRTFLVTEECRYTPINFYFLNKFGAVQPFWFFKERKDSLTVTSEEYETTFSQIDLNKGQFNRYNVNGRAKFSVNTGFISEETNEVIKQLLLSEKVWIAHEDGGIPVTVTSTNLEYKTRQKDRLINYEIEFTYSYNEINNI
jgi:hypothetical protein